MKNLLWLLLGIVIGVGGFYFATRTSQTRVVQPTSSINIAMMFTQAVNDNSLYSMRELMTPLTKNSFTADDLKAIRKYIGAGTKAEGGAGFNNYEVVTFGTNKKPITLWLLPPFATMNHMWAIQGIAEGATLTFPRH